MHAPSRLTLALGTLVLTSAVTLSCAGPGDGPTMPAADVAPAATLSVAAPAASASAAMPSSLCRAYGLQLERARAAVKSARPAATAAAIKELEGEIAVFEAVIGDACE